MDTIFYHGNFYTGDQFVPHCQAIAVKNGVILALGQDKDILPLASDTTKCIDLQGKFVLPGFTDSHMHLLFYAQLADMADLSKAGSFQDVKEICRSHIPQAAAEHKWVQGIGFNQDFWSEKRIPTRLDLDEISADVPITIRRACCHITVCNTPAMIAMGLMGEKRETTSINMGFFAEGTPDGTLREDSQNLISAVLPVPSQAGIESMILRACRQAAAKGITEIHSDDFQFIPGGYGDAIVAAYRHLSETGQLPVRIYQQCALWDLPSLEHFLEQGYRTGMSFGHYRLGPLKLICDGSLGAHTAWMRAPYQNDPSTCGKSNMTDEEIIALCQTAHDHNMQIAVHCIGDAALEQALSTLETVQCRNPRTDCRHGIVHCQIMDPAQQLRFQHNNLLAYIQPVFLRSDMHIVDDCVGTALGSQSYNWRRFADLHVHMSGGSDCPVEPFDILPNLEYAVTRTNPDTGVSWHAEHSLTLEEAIAAFTKEGAYASFSENIRGTLSVGKYADLVVLSQNLFSIPPSEIHTAEVDLTVADGKIVYQKDAE